MYRPVPRVAPSQRWESRSRTPAMSQVTALADEILVVDQFPISALIGTLHEHFHPRWGLCDSVHHFLIALIALSRCEIESVTR